MPVNDPLFAVGRHHPRALVQRMPIVPMLATEILAHRHMECGWRPEPNTGFAACALGIPPIFSPVGVDDQPARNRMLQQLQRSCLATRNGAPMLAHADKSCGPACLEARWCSLPCARSRGGPCASAHRTLRRRPRRPRRVRDTIVLAHRNRFEYTQLDEFHENRGRARPQLYSRLIPARYEACWAVLQQGSPELSGRGTKRDRG